MELGNQKLATQGKERFHPPETKADDSRGEETSTSRKQGRRRWSCRNLHLPESKSNMTSRLHHTKLSTWSRRYSRRSATNDVGSFLELTTTDGDWTRAPIRRSGRGGDGEARELSQRKSEGLRRWHARSRADCTLNPKEDLLSLRTWVYCLVMSLILYHKCYLSFILFLSFTWL